MTCDDYQIGFEQRSAGTESAIPAAKLDAHLATCEVCLAYVAASRKVQDSMLGSLGTVPSAPDLEAMRTLVARRRRTLQQAPVIAAVLMALGVFAIGAWQRGGRDLSPLIAQAAVFGVVMAIAATVFARRRDGQLARAEHRGGTALLHGLRGELERRQVGYRRSLVLAIPVVVSVATSPAAVPLGVFVVGAVVWSVIDYRRIARELAALA